MIICICIHRVRTKTAQIPWKIRSNSWENLTHYYLLTCCIVVNVIVWDSVIGREKQAAGQSRAPGWVMWTKCLPRDTIQPMEYTLRNSNEIICKHKKWPFHVPGKVFGESGQSVHLYLTIKLPVRNLYIVTSRSVVMWPHACSIEYCKFLFYNASSQTKIRRVWIIIMQSDWWGLNTREPCLFNFIKKSALVLVGIPL